MKDRIITLRKALGLTQKQFADGIGVKRGAVTNYEIGRNTPAEAVLRMIATSHANPAPMKSSGVSAACGA